jgi:ATPase subunit of ABC transporter with duplicated ATPase domains
MAHLLGGESLQLEYPTKVVFDSVTIGVSEGDRIGIVGRNGDGKSSLLMMLAGRLQPDGGKVTARGGTTIGVLDQADRFDDGETVGHAIVGDAPEHEWAGNARVREVISGLVEDLDWLAPVDALSGGQRRRVALARLLAGEWDITDSTGLFHRDTMRIFARSEAFTAYSPTQGRRMRAPHDGSEGELDGAPARGGGLRQVG